MLKRIKPVLPKRVKPTLPKPDDGIAKISLMDLFQQVTGIKPLEHPHPAKGMSEAQVRVFEDLCDNGTWIAPDYRTINKLLQRGLLTGPAVDKFSHLDSHLYQVPDQFKEQLNQWRKETGRVDRYYDMDENEVEENDPRAVFMTSWRWGGYDCIAKCTPDNCVCNVDDPDDHAEVARREKLLREALNQTT
jgi:hypothetical protein